MIQCDTDPSVVDTAGALPTEQRAPLPTTTGNVEPAAASPYGQSALDALWAIVEAEIPGKFCLHVVRLELNHRTVEVAAITSLQPANASFLVPDTPKLPPSLQDHAPKKKFPEGFVFGVATAAQQWEGAVKDDGRGPRSV